MPSVAAARITVAAVIAALPDCTVIDYPRAVDQPSKGRWAVIADLSATPAEIACPAPTVVVTVYLFTHLTLDAPAWTELDGWADDVLGAVDQQRAFRWTNLETVIYRDTHPAYRLTLEA